VNVVATETSTLAPLAAAAKPLLQIEDLRTYFFTRDGIVRAVDGVSLAVRRGETLGVVGESGCGKSVTSLSILRLIPDPPGRIVSGSIRFEGVDLLGLSETEMRGLLAHAGRTDMRDVPRKGPLLARSRSTRSSSRDYRDIRNLALVDLLFATGMRVGEVSSLNVDDFSVTELMFRVHGKGGRGRLAYVVDDQTILIQKQHLEARTQLVSESPALFLNTAGERLSTQGIANIIAQFRRDAGIERHITPHMLRHTVATLLLRNGMDIRVVQEFLGHASIATTQRYTHVVKEHLIGELRKHHPSLSLRGQSIAQASQRYSDTRG
jgi:integrase